MQELAKYRSFDVKDPADPIVDLDFSEGMGATGVRNHVRNSVAGMAAAGLGVGILPESMVAPSRLHQLRIRGGAVTRRISIIVRAGRSLSPTADRLKQTLQQVVQGQVGPRVATAPGRRLP